MNLNLKPNASRFVIIAAGGSLMPSSPLNPQQSPAMAAHSPGKRQYFHVSYIRHLHFVVIIFINVSCGKFFTGPNYMQPHAEGSPFAANVMSPAAANWPSSPLPRPSPRPGQSPEHRQQAQGELSWRFYLFVLFFEKKKNKE